MGRIYNRIGRNLRHSGENAQFFPAPGYKFFRRKRMDEMIMPKI